MLLLVCARPVCSVAGSPARPGPFLAPNSARVLEGGHPGGPAGPGSVEPPTPSAVCGPAGPAPAVRASSRARTRPRAPITWGGPPAAAAAGLGTFKSDGPAACLPRTRTGQEPGTLRVHESGSDSLLKNTSLLLSERRGGRERNITTTESHGPAASCASDRELDRDPVHGSAQPRGPRHRGF